MRVPYIISGFPLTFVTNEVESHRRAGWQILPLASSAPPAVDNLSATGLQWKQRTVYRSGWGLRWAATLREMLTHPVRFIRMCLWVLGLVVRSPVESAKAAYEFSTACYFAQRCRQFGAEHLHVHFASRSLNLGLMISILARIRVSCTVHAFDIFTRSAASLRARLSRCCFIAAISEYNIRYLRTLCGDRIADLCHLVRCGVDLETFRAVQRDPRPGRMLCVTKLVPKKGLDVAIKACSLLCERGVKFHFQIVGGGPLRAELENLVDELGLREQVEFLGPVPNDRLVPLMLTASVFVLPCVTLPSGDRDGIPVAIMEAMACEVPVVSTTISGIPELVEDGVNGRLVPEKDPEALAEALGSLVSNMELVQHFGRAARKQVEEHFDVAINAQRLRDLIEQAQQQE